RPSAAHPRGAVGDVQPQRKLGAEPLVDRAADLVERAALRGEPRREHRLAHADVALRAVVGLEAGEQRAMPEMFGALAVAMDAVEHLWSLAGRDRKSTRLNSSHLVISYAVFCLKKKKKINEED